MLYENRLNVLQSSTSGQFFNNNTEESENLQGRKALDRIDIGVQG